MSEAYSEPCQKSKMEFFAKIINGFYPLIILAECSVLDVWQGPEYASASTSSQKTALLDDKYLLNTTTKGSFIFFRYNILS